MLIPMKINLFNLEPENEFSVPNNRDFSRRLFVVGILVPLFLLILNVCAFADDTQRIDAYLKTLDQKLADASTKNDPKRVERVKKEIDSTKQKLALQRTAPKTELATNNPVSTEKTSDTVVGGQVFVYYEKDLKPGSVTPNQFDINRLYVDIKKDLDKNASIRITTDMANEPTLTNQKSIFIKYAYFDLKSISGSDSINLRVGQQPTVWLGFMDLAWRRYVQKSMCDYYGLYTSSDLGLASYGKLNFSGWGFPNLTKVEYIATMTNGKDAGYKKPETNSQKDLGLRFNTELFSNENNKVISALGFYVKDLPFNQDLNLSALTKSVNLMGLWQFTLPIKGNLWFEYVKYTAKIGSSVGGQYNFLNDYYVFGRMDTFDTTLTATTDQYKLYILGLEYNYSKNIRFALDLQNELKNGADNMKKIGIHSEIKF